MEPTPRSFVGRQELWFQGVAGQPSLGEAMTAAVLAGSRKAFGTWAEDWEGAVLMLTASPSHLPALSLSISKAGPRVPSTGRLIVPILR